MYSGLSTIAQLTHATRTVGVYLRFFWEVSETSSLEEL